MKNNIFRIILFIVVVFTGFTGPVVWFAVAAIAYIFLYTGIELIVIAVAIDAYFGYADSGLFVYTISVSAGLFIVQYVKPRLWVYN